MQTEPSEAMIEAGLKELRHFGNGYNGKDTVIEVYLAMKTLDPDLATRTDNRPDCAKCGKPIIMTASECDGCATRTDSPTDAVVQKMVRVINGNLTTGISMGQAERYADEDTALAVIAALTPSGEVERLRDAAETALAGGAERTEAEELAMIEEAFPPKPVCSGPEHGFLPGESLKDYFKRCGTPGDPVVMAEYMRAMREEVIPQIEEDMKRQARAAHFMRLGIPDPAKSDGEV